MNAEVADVNDRRKVALPLSRLVTVVALTVLAMIVFLSRTYPLYDTLRESDGEIRLIGNDPYFHLRHAQYASEHFPHLQRWDPASHFPHIVRSDAAGLFDLSIAAVARAFAGEQHDSEMVSWVAAWTAPVLAAFVVIGIFVVCRSVLDVRLSLLAAVFFVLYPAGSLGRTLLGFGDHHVAEMLLALLTVKGWICGLKKSSPAMRSWLPDVFLTLPMVVFVLTWIGAPIYLAFLGLSGVVVFLDRVFRSVDTKDITLAIFRFFSGTALWMSVVAFVFPEFVIHWTTLRMGIVFAVLMAFVPFILQAVIAMLGRRSVSSTAQGAALVLFLITAAVAVLLLVPSLRNHAVDLLRTRSKLVDEQFYAALTHQLYFRLFGLPGIIAVAALPLILQRCRKEIVDDSTLSLAVICTAFWAYAVTVGDYEYVVAVMIPILAGLCLKEAAPMLFSFRRSLTVSVMILLLIVPMWPLGFCQVPFAHRQLVTAVDRYHDGWREAMDWLRTETPQPTVPSNAVLTQADAEQPRVESDYGVLTSWDFGNFVNAMGRRSAVTSRYPDSFFAQWATSISDAAADAVLQRSRRNVKGIRYVVLDNMTMGDSFPAIVRQATENAPGKRSPKQLKKRAQLESLQTESVAGTLYFEGGQSRPHHRLVFESGTPSAHMWLTVDNQEYPRSFVGDDLVSLFAQLPENQSVDTPLGTARDIQIRPAVMIFERIAGAVIEGQVADGFQVHAILPLKCGASGRTFTSIAAADISGGGTFSVTIPYATEFMPGSDVQATSVCQLVVTRTNDGRQAAVDVEISDTACREGATISLGALTDSP